MQEFFSVNEEDKVDVIGVADSRVAQGLIALLALSLRELTADDVLELSGESCLRNSML